MSKHLRSYVRKDKLQPLCELSQNDRDYVFEYSKVISLAPHTLVTPEKDSVTYLLEGEISMLSGGFVIEKFTHADQRGLAPMFDEEKGEDGALLTSHGAILEVDRKLFEGLYNQRNADSGAIEKDKLQEEEQQLFLRLRMALKSDNLHIPTLPEAALKVRQVINQPDVTIAEKIQIVQTDPTLSARLIKVANSPLYGTWREIKSVRDAVRRLGQETTRSLTFSLSVRQLFRAKSTLIKQQVEQVYEESIHVSALAYVIALHQASHLDPEQALLAGLLHRLGMIPILNYLDDNPGLISSTQSIQKSLDNLTVPLSQVMFNKWHFDESFLEVVESCEQWYRDTGGPVDYVDVVIAAKLLFRQKRNLLNDSMTFATIPIVEKLNLLDPGKPGLDFYVMARSEIEEMQSLLKI
jgi:HD-like signal output (HDOD) protein